MAIQVYMSGNSGNKEIVTHQQRIFMILKSLSIEFEPVDITAPGMESKRDFMRKHGKKKDGHRNVLPPQIFNDEKYCGDYDAFDLANEDDELEEFLGIPRITPKSIPFSSKSENTNNVTSQLPNGHSEQSTQEDSEMKEAGLETPENQENVKPQSEENPVKEPDENPVLPEKSAAEETEVEPEEIAEENEEEEEEEEAEEEEEYEYEEEEEEEEEA